MLGLKDPFILFQYTAVLGDSNQSKYESLVERYLKWGFSDFKIKLNGNLQQDQLKLSALNKICEEAGVENRRIRLDANNLWPHNTNVAIDYLAQLKVPFIGIEEPVEPKKFKCTS